MSDTDGCGAEEQVIAEEHMRHFLPRSFGRPTKEANIAARLEQSRRQIPSPLKKPLVDEQNSDSEFESDDGDEFPVTHELVLKTHDRAVTSVSLDPAGSRLISGSLDGTIRFHDFASMTPTTLRAFKTLDPWETKKSSAAAESHAIQHVQFGHLSGAVFLCITAHPQPKILSRDGDLVADFVKGDMYLRDMHHTKGHVGEVTSGAWHPNNADICLTAGSDSTLRIWDINNKRSHKDVIVFKSKAAGSAGRTRMTAVAWAHQRQGGNNILVAAALDGSLVMYSGNGPFNRPAGEVRKAHRPETWTGGIDVSPDGRMVVTRGGDDKIKLWDTRKFKEPLVEVEHASTSARYPMTNIRYATNSSNSSSIVTGSSTGDLHILNPANLRPELVTPITPAAPLITVEWHAKLNQIITGSANAETRVLFSPSISTRGAAEVMSRAPKKRHVDDNPAFTTDQSLGLSGESIVTPGATVPGSKRGGVTASGKSRDPRRPQLQQITPFMRSQPDEKHISENIPLSHMLHEDPREALLKYADIAKEDPMFTKAWQETQPVTEYAQVSDEDEGPDKKRTKR